MKIGIRAKRIEDSMHVKEEEIRQEKRGIKAREDRY